MPVKAFPPAFIHSVERAKSAVLCFIALLILDNSTLFDIPLSNTYVLSSNFSTWLSAQFLGVGFVDGFSFAIIGMYLMVLVLLVGTLRSPFRNLWAMQFSWLAVFLLLLWQHYQLWEDHSQVPVLVSGILHSLKLIPLGLACWWTKRLALPLLI